MLAVRQGWIAGWSGAVVAIAGAVAAAAVGYALIERPLLTRRGRGRGVEAQGAPMLAAE